MYETEKTRLQGLVSESTGITRTALPDLTELADERAYEGYLEVGTGPYAYDAEGKPLFKGITHPTQAVLESRLGPTWTGMGVGEIAWWGYQRLDPIQSALNAWLTSPAHYKVISDPKYKYLSVGVNTWKAASDPELERRWYVIGQVSINAPEGASGQRFTDVAPGDPFFADIEWMAQTGITTGTGDGTTFSPTQPVTRGQMAAFMHRLDTYIRNNE